MLVKKEPYYSRKKLLAVILAAVFLLISFFFSGRALADDPVNNGLNAAATIGLPNSPVNDIRLVAANILRYFLTFVGIIAVGMIIYGGYLWSVSGGDPDRINRAKKILKNAVIGLIVIISAFAIVTFIISLLTGGLPGGRPGGRKPPDPGRGIGVLGECSLESVYPEPGQKEVPRNTMIIITFKEEIKVDTIIKANGYIQDDGRIKIYTTDATNYLKEVKISTNDNKTFVLQPDNYLGSATEYITYTVYLSNDIKKKADNQGIFSNCRGDFFQWSFEVSNKLDLTPPQVLNQGVFPPPDNEPDVVNFGAAVAAQGKIEVNFQPRPFRAASITDVAPVNSSPAASVSNVNRNLNQNGPLKITVSADALTASLENTDSHNQLGTAVISGQAVSFSGFFTLTLTSGSFSAGQAWTMMANAAQISDEITVGSLKYSFIESAPASQQILMGASVNETAARITAQLNNHPDVTAAASGTEINLSARLAGSGGNNIFLGVSNTNIFTVTPLAGGTERAVTRTIKDKRDQPRNAVIQIDFNEAINPLTVSGAAGQVKDYIKVVDLTDPSVFLSGKFVLSNQYRTVEFVSDQPCGVNSCGEQIFCLPANSQLRVWLKAADLDDCNNCSTRSPYTTCVNAHCQNAAGENYPLSSSALNGLMDLAANSLDGNRTNGAQGPQSEYDENIKNTNLGDNYQWSFYTSAEIEISAPEIDALQPVHGQDNFPLAEAIKIDFNKLMMSSSLLTGERTISNGPSIFKHKYLNLWNFAGYGTGYWTAKQDLPLSAPDHSQVEIRHTELPALVSWRAQAGSGLKDIYQNCFVPVKGKYNSNDECEGNETEPSCCPKDNSDLERKNVGPGANCP
ncbi:hypothetical protein COX69_01960 [Candidatus Falkowbacteria bacterium CG_4_10_14_0_2_um_filter_48_10]|nr:MAG: hypothetical protein COX69_01960 [Candidatus Falkowbacteria bacterium CG_4_10_14_0_2_um_filter_48_10]